MRGGVKLDGGYVPFQYPNGAARFLADSLMAEMDVDAAGRPVGQRPDNPASPQPVMLSTAP